MSAEERERGPEAGGPPPGGVAAASEAAPSVSHAEPAPADAPGEAPAATAAPDATDTPVDALAGTATAAPPTTAAPGRPAVAGARDGLGTADLQAVLAAVFPGGTACRHWCARLDAIGPLAAGLPADLAAWTEGRAWGAGAEVRWQQDGAAGYRVLYLGEGDTLPDGFAPLGADLRALPGEAAAGLYLWGQRGDDRRYHATRLPRPLDYPAAAGAPAVRLPYQRLVGPDGLVRFLRLTLGEEA
jgi:hypothetical protein